MNECEKDTVTLVGIIPELMAKGYSCAEAVGSVLVQDVLKRSDIPVRALMRPFRGGVAGSHEELCGALSGALAALGLAADAEAEPVGAARYYSAQMRDRFRERFGTSRCGELIAGLSDEERPLFCRALCRDTALLALKLLEEGVGS